MGFLIRKNQREKERKNIRILCISDHIDPLVYSPYIKKRFAEVDLILGAGDLPLSYYDFIVSSLNRPLFFIFGNHNFQELEHIKKNGKFAGDVLKYNDINCNCSDNSQNSCFCGGFYIGGKVIKHNKLLIAGLDGSMWYNGNENQYTEQAMLFYLLQLIPGLLWNKIWYGRYLDIFLTHAPPFHIHDKADICHRGFKVFRWFLKTFKPKAHIHGHIHLYGDNTERETCFAQTRVINAYDHDVIVLEV
jgi:Icc-related predicted phosphoesterase